MHESMHYVVNYFCSEPNFSISLSDLKCSQLQEIMDCLSLNSHVIICHKRKADHVINLERLPCLKSNKHIVNVPSINLLRNFHDVIKDILKP